MISDLNGQAPLATLQTVSALPHRRSLLARPRDSSSRQEELEQFGFWSCSRCRCCMTPRTTARASWVVLALSRSDASCDRPSPHRHCATGLSTSLSLRGPPMLCLVGCVGMIVGCVGMIEEKFVACIMRCSFSHSPMSPNLLRRRFPCPNSFLSVPFGTK